MKNLYFLYAIIALFLAYGCDKSLPVPNLGKVVDGHLINVDEYGVILQGYDAVSFRNGGSEKGDPMFMSKHDGATYYFASAENKTMFDANPVAFVPEYGGYCAYGVSLGKLAPIEVWTFDTTFQNRNIFQHNQKAVNGWKKDVPGNYAKAQMEWVKLQDKYLKKM